MRREHCADEFRVRLGDARAQPLQGAYHGAGGDHGGAGVPGALEEVGQRREGFRSCGS
jgi:hypothetical protein